MAHEEDDFTRLELLREVALLYEGKARDPERAFERYLSAFEISPGDEACREDVERLAKATGTWDKVIDSYRRAIEHARARASRTLSVSLHLKLGRVLVDEVGNVDEALTEFRSVYEVDGENADAISALEGLYRQTSRFEDLLGIYEKKRELTAEFDERREVLYAIAALFENEMAKPEQAIETYVAVLEDDPTDVQSLKALDALYRAQEDYANYADVLRRLIELDVTEDELVDLKFRLGATLEQHLSDPMDALRNYREILSSIRTMTGREAALENMLTNEDLAAEAAQILDPIYEAREDWERLIGVLEVLAGCQEDVVERVDILRRIARTASGQLNDLERAFDAQARALKQDPANTEARTELELLAEEAQAWGKLEGIFAEIAEALTDVELARDYWMRLAGIEERLEKS